MKKKSETISSSEFLMETELTGDKVIYLSITPVYGLWPYKEIFMHLIAGIISHTTTAPRLN